MTGTASGGAAGEALSFEPDVMYDAAVRLVNGAGTNHDLMADLSLATDKSIGDVPADEYDVHVAPVLAHVRRNAADRRRALREIASFVTSKAVLAEIADGLHGANVAKVHLGKEAKGLLPGGVKAAVDGVTGGLKTVADNMEREFLGGGWLDKAGRMHGRSGARGAVHSWTRISKLAKGLSAVKTADDAVEMYDALFGKGGSGKRIESLSGIVGELGGGAVATAATIALLSGPALPVGLLALGVGLVGSQLGKSAGKYIGKNVIVPLWNGIKSVGSVIKAIPGIGISLVTSLAH